MAVVGAPLQVENYQDLAVRRGNTLTIDRSVVSGGITSLPLNFSVVQGPSHGSATTAVNGHDSWLTYTPLSNYTGRDTFTFKAIQYKNTSNIGKVSVIANPKPILDLLPEQLAGLSFGLSLILVSFIFIGAYLILKRRRRRQRKDSGFQILGYYTRRQLVSKSRDIPVPLMDRGNFIWILGRIFN